MRPQQVGSQSPSAFQGQVVAPDKASSGCAASVFYSRGASNVERGDSGESAEASACTYVAERSEGQCSTRAKMVVQPHCLDEECRGGVSAAATEIGSLGRPDRSDNVHLTASRASIESVDAPIPVTKVPPLPPESEIASLVVNKHVFLFLDYDGTLTPIVSNPSDARLPRDVRELLFDLSSLPSVTVSIVTGRSMPAIREFVLNDNGTERTSKCPGENELLFAACHGFMIEHDQLGLRRCVGAESAPLITSSSDTIREGLKHIPGILVENNELAVAVHYRNVPPEYHAEMETFVNTYLYDHHDTLKKSYGKKVIEIRLNRSWDKGKAVLWILDFFKVNLDDPDVCVVYVGDDKTDEDALRAIKACKNHLGVRVNSSEVTYSHTHASYAVEDSAQVFRFLQTLHRILVDSVPHVVEQKGS